jgi:hypothetical protein
VLRVLLENVVAVCGDGFVTEAAEGGKCWMRDKC